MVRYVAPASWLLAAGLLAITVGQHGTWATSTPDSLETNTKEPESSVEIVDDNKVDSSAWSLPEAIAKATGHEPITEWKEYLFKDPFGGEDDVGSTAAIFPLRETKTNGGYQVNWKGGNTGGGGTVRGSKVWWPSITCPYGGSMDVDNFGKEKCIGVGQGICKDGWQFGIRHHVDNTYLMLWREDDPMNPVYKWFPGATSLCIGERYPNVAYLRVVYEDCLYYLIGPGAGSADNLARLKIVADNQRHKPNDVIVKFRDGPGDQNALWQIFANGYSQTSPDALWYPIPCDTESPSSSPSATPTISMKPSASPSDMPSSSPSASPSTAPSSSPSASPSAAPSSSPSGSPSSSPTTEPSSLPSASPSSAPSASPSSSPTSEPSSSPSSSPTSTPSSEPSISSQPTAASCLPSPAMNIGTNAGGSLTFTLTSMPLAVFYVELRTFVRGDFGQPSEFATFSWINGTEPLPPPIGLNPDNFIGINDGGNGIDCDPVYHQEAFAIPVDTYNAWVQEGNGTIPIYMQTSDDVNVCDPYAEAYIQIQVDEGCGTFSNAPSSSPSSRPSNVPSTTLAPSSSPSSKPSNEPTLSAEPSSAPSTSSQPTAASCLPSPTMDTGTPGGSLTFALTSMPLASFYVELRTFVRGDFSSNSEFADFFWVNATETLPPPANQDNFIGRNGGGGDCDIDYFQQAFVVSVDTYNSWVQEGNGTIPIYMDTPGSVNVCGPTYAEAFIQFQVDEGCGTFSNAPSSLPSATPSSKPTASQSPSSSPAPSHSPSISLAPSSSPSDVPSARPSISVRPSQSPSSTPSILPSISFEPSSTPSQSFAPSSSPSISPSSPPSTSSQPTAVSCLPSPEMELEEAGGNIVFILKSMPMATFYVELRTFIRGDYDGGSEYADFFWVNSTSGQASLPRISRNGGGSPQCSTFFLEETFVIPVETYNSWIEEGNGILPILMDASNEVDVFCGNNTAYIQFQVDEACGTFSTSPSTLPSSSPSNMPSTSSKPSLMPSNLPSVSPSLSFEPSSSQAPSISPSLSLKPSSWPSQSAAPTVSSAPTSCTDTSILTTFNANNGQSGNMFDVTAKEKIEITGIKSVNIRNAGSLQTLVVFTKRGSYVGFETNSSAWTQWGRLDVISAGPNVPTFVPSDSFVVSFVLSAGETRSFYVYLESSDIRYRNGVVEGGLLSQDESLQVFTGIGRSLPAFAGSRFTPRSWNGEIAYTKCSTSSSSSPPLGSGEASSLVASGNFLNDAKPSTGGADEMTEDELWVFERIQAEGLQSEEEDSNYEGDTGGGDE